MNVLEKVKYFAKVWQLALPHIPPPAPEDAARWAVYSSVAVEAAILRTAKRFAPARITHDFVPVQAYRYATATARSIAQAKGEPAYDQ